MKIQFETHPGSRHMEIPVYVNGKGPFTFTVDTGATATTLTKSFAENLGIEMRKERRKDWDKIGQPYEVATLENFQIGTLDIPSEDVIIFELDKLLGFSSDRISGNIGHSTLGRFVFGIEFETKYLSLLDKIDSGYDASKWVDFNYVNNTHLIGVPTSINGSKPIDLVLDTGSPPTILTPSAAESLGLTLSESGPLVKGLNGTTRAYTATIDEIRVGEAKQLNTDILVLDLSAVSARGDDLPNGILGLSFLNRYELVIDYPERRILLNK